MATSPKTASGRGTRGEATPHGPDIEQQNGAPDALASAMAISDDYNRSNALAALAPRLPEALLPDAHTVAAAISDEIARANALAALAPRMPETLPEAFAAATAISDDYARAHALAALAPHLAGSLQLDALAAAKGISDDYTRANVVLAALAPHLPETLLPDALAAATAISREIARADALGWLAPRLPETLLREALAAATAIQFGAARANALIALAPRLPETLLPDALAAAAAISDGAARADALAALAPHLPEPLLPDALAAAKAISDEHDRANVLVALAPCLPEALLLDALAAAKAISDEHDRAKALAGLAPRLPEPLLPEAFAAAEAISGEHDRAEALAGLAPYLPEPALREGLAAAKAIMDESARARALVALAPRLPETLPEALAVAVAISDGYHDYDRAAALAGLAPYLPELLLPDALAAAMAISSDYDRAQALVALYPRLPEALLPDALAAAVAISRGYARAQALVALAPRLPEALLPDALAAANAISDDNDRADALAALAPRLPELGEVHPVSQTGPQGTIRLRRSGPPDDKPFGITLAFSGKPDDLKAERDFSLAFSELAKALSVEYLSGGTYQKSTAGYYFGHIVAFSAVSAPIVVLINSGKDILVKWLELKKQNIYISLPGGWTLQVRSVKELGEVLGYLRSAFVMNEITPVPSVRGEQAMETIRILFVSANPASTPALRLDEEVHEIEAKIRASKHRESLQLITKWAVRPDDLLQYLNQHMPHVVHFSGHGSPTEEIILLDWAGNPKPVSKEALTSLFHTLKDNIRVVLLNACFSRPQAEAITEEIDCAIGMTRAIGDRAAITFAASFYRAIGFGRSVKDAFQQGRTALLLEGIPEEHTPALITRENIAADLIVLIKS